MASTSLASVASQLSWSQRPLPQLADLPQTIASAGPNLGNSGDGNVRSRTVLSISNVYVTLIVIAIEEYIDRRGTSPFGRWFNRLNALAAARVTVAVDRLEQGGGDTKSVGKGVRELRIDFGPGYRIYHGIDGDRRIILLCAGTKTRQQNDIVKAQGYWRDYKARKPRR